MHNLFLSYAWSDGPFPNGLTAESTVVVLPKQKRCVIVGNKSEDDAASSSYVVPLEGTFCVVLQSNVARFFV